MSAAVRAGLLYFLTVFAAGLLLGAIRVYALAPLVGESLAVLVELPALLALAWMVSRTLIDRLAVPRHRRAGLIMGLLAFALLLLAEAAFAMLLAGKPLAEHLRTYQVAPGLLGLAGQILFALFPMVQIYWAESRRR